MNELGSGYDKTFVSSQTLGSPESVGGYTQFLAEREAKAAEDRRLRSIIVAPTLARSEEIDSTPKIDLPLRQNPPYSTD